MLQIVFNHLIGDLPNGGANIPARPKMSSPVSLFHVWKLLEQKARSPSFDSPHDSAGGHSRRSTDQNRDIIFAHYAFYNPYLKRFAGLSHQLSDSFCYVTTQHLVTLLGDPNKMVLNWVNRMAAVSIIHCHFLGRITAAKADRLKPVV